MRPPRRTPAHSRVPTVNLLSPWVFESLAARRLRRRFAAAAAVLALLVGAGWMVQNLRTSIAERELAARQAETTKLLAQTKRLAPVRTYVAAVDQQKAMAQGAMENEVYLSRVLSGLRAATPAGARLENVAVKVSPVAKGDQSAEASAAAAAEDATGNCPGPDPFNTREVIGCVTLSGSASTRALVGDLVVALGKDALFVEPFISATTTAAGDDVVFTGSVGLSAKTFSGRYAAMDDLLAGVAR